MKISSIYTCGQCAYQTAKWVGKCPQCEAWNSFTLAEVRRETGSRRIRSHARTPESFSVIAAKARGTESRIVTKIPELDLVLGGGIIMGSITLLAGEPGIGKSTLTLQIAEAFSMQGRSVLYISGEESEEQIVLRAERLSLSLKNLSILSETNLETIIATATEHAPDFLIIDSIQVTNSQNIPGTAGSVSQVRLCAEAILEFAKPKRLPVLLIGHVTKDGTLAGPRVLEHLVDVVLYLEGSRSHEFRLLRGVKNRFGSVSEVGIFEMTVNGLGAVENPSSYFIKKRSHASPGTALTVTMEGTRVILVEVQALTNQTSFGYAQRRASGYDVNRLNLLIAAIQKHLNVNLGNQDIFINVVAGYRLNDPAADLAIVLAILSSYYKKSVPNDCVALGEVGLSGEIRIPSNAAKREKEVTKLGLKLLAHQGELRSSVKSALSQ